MDKILEAIAALKGTILDEKQIKSMIDAALSEVKEKKDDPEVKVSEKELEMEAKLEKMKKQIAELTAGNVLNIPEQGNEALVKSLDLQHRYFKHGEDGEHGLSKAEMKLMTSNNNTTGGYLAGEQLDREILKDITEFNPLMRLATVKNTKSKTYSFLTKKKITRANTVQEGKEGAIEDIEFGKIEINTYVYQTEIHVTQEDIDDAEKGDLVGTIREEMVESISEGTGEDFIIGDDVDKPQGFLEEDAIQTIETETASTFAPDDILNLFYSLKGPYKSRASWLANSEILLVIAKMKDNEGRYMFNRETLDKYPGSVGMLLNRPVYEAPAMSGTDVSGAVVDDTDILAVGDWKKGYCIVNRRGTEVTRDDLTGRNKRVVKFFGTKRLGGHVVKAEAIKKLRVKATV